ncbi:hypothetical protein BXZ70DRAFT_903374 [Cristinia sonorae]|uniref:Uncharacterized protein n=1 Tax=Cristinia sonorae TaxID=1940300 RepID=A0A8K0V0D4_9AGAR|nr:hypothetical protein BXZ70DRAFT_903374 [Cristinia sonorae]
MRSRSIFLFPFLSSLAVAAPLELVTALPGDLTLGLQLPTQIPNVAAPVPALAAPTGVPSPGGNALPAGAPGVPQAPGVPKLPNAPHVPGVPGLPVNAPVRRAVLTQHIHPRFGKNADYGISPNSTFTPLADEETEMKRRGILPVPGDVGGSPTPGPASRPTRPTRPSRNRPQDSQGSGRDSGSGSGSGSSADSPLSGLGGFSGLPGASDSKAANSEAGANTKPSPQSSHPAATKTRPEHPDAPVGGSEGGGRRPSGPGGPYAAVSDGLKTAGSAPDAISNVLNTLPLSSLPNTPVTAPDGDSSIKNKTPILPDTNANPVPKAEEGAAKAEAVPTEAEAVPVEAEEVPAEAEHLPVQAEHNIPSNPVQGKAVSGTKTRRSVMHYLRSLNEAMNLGRASRTLQSRHSLVLSTDPLVPPQPDANGVIPGDRDPRTGLLNIDSNSKPELPDTKQRLPTKPPGIPERPEAPGLPKTQGKTESKESKEVKRGMVKMSKRFVALDTVAATTTYYLPQSTAA